MDGFRLARLDKTASSLPTAGHRQQIIPLISDIETPTLILGRDVRIYPGVLTRATPVKLVEISNKTACRRNQICRGNDLRNQTESKKSQ